MGGLAKRLPVVMVLFVVAAAAICALPPLNGFAGEWVLYIGLFRTLGLGDAPGAPAAALAAVALAMTGALAVACFVKALGAVFLGAPRSASPRHVHQPGVAMVAPMVLLAVACVLIGLCPRLITPLLDAAVGAWSGQSQPLSTASVVPLKALACAGGALVGLLAAWALFLKANRRAKPVRTGLTWDCGYAAPTGRMEYTGSSFGDSLVKLTVFLLWPKRIQPALHGLFPKPARFKMFVPDTVLDRLVTPLFRASGRYLPRLRVLQRGQTHVYVLYILVVVIVLLIWGNLER